MNKSKGDLSRRVVYHRLLGLSFREYLSLAENITVPHCIYLNNSNLLYAIHGSLKLESDMGGIREAFFVNQVTGMHKVALHDKGNFVVDERWIIEVGGKGKNGKQIRGEKEAYLAVDDTKIGFGNKIPLYLFGFLY